MDELLAFAHARLADEQAWAEACQGHHWQWVLGGEAEVVMEPKIDVQEFAPPDEFYGSTLSLRSVETEMSEPLSRPHGLPPFPPQPLPKSWPISTVDWDAVMSAAAGHILRHDPARTLRDVEARRTTLVRCQEEMLSGIPRLVHFAKMTVWEMASRWSDHKEFREDWRP